MGEDTANVRVTMAIGLTLGILVLLTSVGGVLEDAAGTTVEARVGIGAVGGVSIVAGGATAEVDVGAASAMVGGRATAVAVGNACGCAPPAHAVAVKRRNSTGMDRYVFIASLLARLCYGTVVSNPSCK